MSRYLTEGRLALLKFVGENPGACFAAFVQAGLLSDSNRNAGSMHRRALRAGLLKRERAGDSARWRYYLTERGARELEMEKENGNRNMPA